MFCIRGEGGHWQTQVVLLPSAHALLAMQLREAVLFSHLHDRLFRQKRFDMGQSPSRAFQKANKTGL